MKRQQKRIINPEEIGYKKRIGLNGNYTISYYYKKGNLYLSDYTVMTNNLGFSWGTSLFGAHKIVQLWRDVK